MALPGVLGCIHLFYGLKNLIAAVSVMALIHMILPAPFLIDGAAYALGFNKGAQTTIKEYVEGSKLLGGKIGQVNRGAHAQFHSYLWKFLDEKVYDQDSFANACYMVLLGINVYYFFIRRWSLPGCIQNVFSKASSRFTQTDRAKLVEVIAIMLVSGAVMMPGAHK